MSERSLRLLIVDDSEDDTLLLTRHISKQGYDVRFERVDTEGDMTDRLKNQPWDAIVSDFSMPRFSGPEALKTLQASGLDLPFIVVSGKIGEDRAVSMLKSGAHDFVNKDNLHRLVPAIVREIREAEVREHRRKVERELMESEAKYRLLVETMNDGLAVDSAEGVLTFANDKLAQMLGMSRKEIEGQPATGFLNEANREIYSRQTHERKRGSDEAYELEWRRRDGTAVNTIVSPRPLTDEDGTYAGSFAVITDVTHLKESERRIRESLNEKEVLLREIHHRVKNNLQIVSSLLFLQARTDGSPELMGLMNEARDRIRSMALVHETLYQSDNLAQVDMGAYLRRLAATLQHLRPNPRVQILPPEDTLHLPIDTAVPCGLIVNELITNALKHAFPDRRPGEIKLDIESRGPEENAISVRDDGVGLPADWSAESSTGLGWRLITTLLNQIRGKLMTSTESGAAFTITFASSRKS